MQSLGLHDLGDSQEHQYFAGIPQTYMGPQMFTMLNLICQRNLLKLQSSSAIWLVENDTLGCHIVNKRWWTGFLQRAYIFPHGSSTTTSNNNPDSTIFHACKISCKAKSPVTVAEKSHSERIFICGCQKLLWHWYAEIAALEKLL